MTRQRYVCCAAIAVLGLATIVVGSSENDWRESSQAVVSTDRALELRGIRASQFVVTGSELVFLSQSGDELA
jgi:tRNA(Arg) A34 adenosine deaminase TadA